MLLDQIEKNQFEAQMHLRNFVDANSNLTFKKFEDKKAAIATLRALT